MNWNYWFMTNAWDGKILKCGPVTEQGFWRIGTRLRKSLGLVADIKRRNLEWFGNLIKVELSRATELHSRVHTLHTTVPQNPVNTLMLHTTNMIIRRFLIRISIKSLTSGKEQEIRRAVVFVWCAEGRPYELHFYFNNFKEINFYSIL
jgi:hypothetical protein